MGTGCSVAREAPSDILPSIKPDWLDLQPTNKHHVNISNNRNTFDIKLSIMTNDSVIWSYVAGLYSKWRIIEVFKRGTQYFPIEGGTNDILDREHTKIETVFHFANKLSFAVIPNAIEFSPTISIAFFIRIIVTERHPIKCSVSESGFEHSSLIGQIDLPFVFIWKNLHFPISIGQGEVDFEHNLFKITKHYTAESGQSGQIIFTPKKTGVMTFAVWKEGGNEIIDICSIRTCASTLVHSVEVRKGDISPLVSEVPSDTLVLFKLKDVNIAFSDENFEDFNEKTPQPYFYRTFTEPGIHNFVTIEGIRNVSGLIIVLPPSKHHNIEYTKTNFDSIVLKCKTGDSICFTNVSEDKYTKFTVKYAQKTRMNPHESFAFREDLVKKHFQSGYIEFKVMTMGVYIFTTEEGNFLVVIASQSPKTHNVMVENKGFSPNLTNIMLDDTVLWYWGGQTLLHNIVQVTFNGESIEQSLNPFFSGTPSSNTGFHKQFGKVGNYYYISEGHTETIRGEIVVWPSPKVHIIPCTVELALQPNCIAVSVNDWIVWISQPGLLIDIEIDSCMASDIDSFLTRMNAICYAFNVPLSGLIKFNFKITSQGLEEGLAVPFCIVSDEILSPNTIHFPLITEITKYINSGDCLLLNSNKEIQMDIEMNSQDSDQFITIPLDPYERILITFWKQGLYKLAHAESIVNVNVSDGGIKISPTPVITSPEFNEITLGESLEVESVGEMVIYTLDSSYPNLGRKNTQILSENRVSFQREGLYICRAVGIDEGHLNSKVITIGPLHITNPGQFSFRPNFSIEVISHSSVLLSWKYARKDNESLFEQSLLHNDISIALETVNTCILTDLTSETDQQIILQLSHFETNKLLANINYSFYFPLYKDTIAPLITIEKDPPGNLARISWDRHVHTIPIVNEYAVYVDRQLNCRFPAVLTLGSNDRGDESKCVVLLEDLEEGEVYSIKVSAIATTFEGTLHTFNSQEIPFNNLNSKSLTSEEPKLTSTELDSGSSSIVSDVLSGIITENLSQTSVHSSFSEESIQTLEKSDTKNQNNITDQPNMTKNIENYIQTNVLEQSINNNFSVEIGVKNITLDFIEVFWHLVDDTQEIVNTNLNSLVVTLNSIEIHSTTKCTGSIKLDEFQCGVINHLVVEAYFYEYSINKTRNSSEIFFAKPTGRHPESLILKETDTQLRNAIEFRFRNNFSVWLKSLKLRLTTETEHFRELLNSAISKVEFVRYKLVETAPSGEKITFSDIISLKRKELESTETPNISISTNKKRLRIHQCNPGHTYTLFATLIYSKSELSASKNRLFIFPFKSETSGIDAICAAPPTISQPTLSYLSRSGIRIVWKEPSILKAPIIGFAVFINDIPIDEVLQVSVRSFYLKSPTPGNTYTFTIKPLTNHSCGNSNGASFVGIQPINAYDMCSVSAPLDVLFEQILPLPRIISFTSCVGTSIRVDWNVEDQEEIFLTPDCFTLSWQPVGTSLECKIEKKILYRKIPKFSYKLLGLIPWTEYQFEIRLFAKDKNKKGQFLTTKCEPHIFTSIGPPLSPANLKTESIWFDKIRTVWDPIDPKFREMVPSHIWAFVYYKNKVFVRFNKVNNTDNYFEMDNLKPNTLYLIEFYGVLNSLNLQFDASNDPIEGYEMRNKILLSLHSSICFEVETLSIDFHVSLTVVSNDDNCLEVSWNEALFQEGVKMLCYTLECGTDDTLDDIQYEDESRQKQTSTLTPETKYHTFTNLISGLLYRIQLKSQFLEESESISSPFTVLLCETRFRLPAPPEKPIVFLSEITQSTILFSWNKSRSHFATDSNIKTVFKGYHLFVNEISHRILQRDITKYSICIKKTEVLKIKLIALGNTVCRTKSDKNLVFDETNESDLMLVDLESFGGNFDSISINFLKFDSSEITSDSIDGYIAVSWQLKRVFFHKFSTIKLIWWYESDQNQNEIILPSTQNEFQIEKPTPKEICCVKINLNFEGKSIFSPIFKCQIPTLPENPVITSKSKVEKGVTLRWHEPRQYGDILVTGYQVYNDDVIIGPILHPNTMDAFLPLNLSESYSLKLEALTALPNIKIFSNTIETKQKILKIGKHKMIDTFIKEVKSQSIEIGWSYLNPPKGISPNHYRVEWSSIQKPSPKIALLPNTLSSYTIRECFPGKIYFIHVKVVGKGEKIILSSTQLKVQTSAPPLNPTLIVKSLSSNKIELTWKRPIEYGAAKISSYTLFIDKEYVDIDENANAYVYNTFPCQTHTFKMLANTDSIGPSKLSDSLIIRTPGLKMPVPKQDSSGKLDSIALTWESVAEVGNVKLTKLDVFCAPKQNGTITQSIDMYLSLSDCKCHVDMTDDTYSDTFHSLSSQSDFVVFLKATDCKGSEYFSEIVEMSTAKILDAPEVIFTNLSLVKQNRTKDELVEFLNERDSVQLKLCWQQTKSTDIRTTKGQKIVQEISELAGTLFNIEKSILNRLKYLKSQSTLISVHLKWDLVLSTSEVSISGYEVLVNDCKQSILSKQQTNCTVEINKTKFPKSVSISLRTITEHPIGPGEESKELTFDWGSDLPSFSYFCLNNYHSKDGNCLYLQTFDGERSFKHISSLKDLITRGHFQSHTHPTKTKVWNLFHERLETFPLRLHLGSLNFVLFWTFWCEPSQKALEFFVRFAEQHSESMKFTCICVNSGEKQNGGSHQSELINYFQSHFYESAPIEFVCGCGDKISPNPAQIFSIYGVPTFAIFHPTGTLGWIGRHASKNFQNFESFFIHTANTVHEVDCEIENCDYCVQKNQYRSVSHSYSFLSEKTRSIHSSGSGRTTSATSTSKLRSSQKSISSVYSVKQKPKMYQPMRK